MVFLAIGLMLLSMGVISVVWLVRNANRPVTANAGPWALRETDRLTTGQQRVDRVAFAADGDRLAGICPRYNRLLTYQVDSELKLRPIAETQLEGRPVSIVPLGSRFLVLQRPAGDQKHLEPGWWEMYDPDGKKVGSRNLAGFYPDDFAPSPDGRYLFVLSSGRAEGDQKKPLPALEVVAIDRIGSSSRSVGRLTLDPTDDPARLTLSASGRFAAVFLAKSKRTAAVDLTIPEAPRTDRSDANCDGQRSLPLRLTRRRLDHDARKRGRGYDRDRVAWSLHFLEPPGRQRSNPVRRLLDLHSAERIGPGNPPDGATARAGPLPSARAVQSGTDKAHGAGVFGKAKPDRGRDPNWQHPSGRVAFANWRPGNQGLHHGHEPGRHHPALSPWNRFGVIGRGG